jgi:hypothetical protein
LSGKAQVGARHIARMRGAFSWARLAASSGGKPLAKAVDDDATRANVGATSAKRSTNPRDLESVGGGPVDRLQIDASLRVTTGSSLA